MSFNQKLRQAVYGDARAARVNPILGMPAGVTGMTWQGTGFEQAPAEPVELDQAALPWELQPEEGEVHLVQPTIEEARSRASIHYGAGVSVVLGVIVVALIIVGAY